MRRILGIMAIFGILALVGLSNPKHDEPSKPSTEPAASGSGVPTADEKAPEAQPSAHLDYSRPVYTKERAIVCPTKVFFDRRVGHGFDAVMDAYLSVFYRQTNAEKAGCQVWHGGIAVRASPSALIPGFISVDDVYVMKEFELTNDPGGERRATIAEPPRPSAATVERIGPVTSTASVTPTDHGTAAYQRGLRDRAIWEEWFNSLQGDYKTGAFYWAGQRSLPHPGSCQQMNDDFSAGCAQAKMKLSQSDALRKTEPNYKAGWNAWTPSEPNTASSVQNVPPAVAPPAAKGGTPAPSNPVYEYQPSTTTMDDTLRRSAQALENTLREEPWKEGLMRAIGANPRTGPMPPLSPAEQGCKQKLDHSLQRCNTEISQKDVPECSADAFGRDLDQCVANLRTEWLKTH